MVIYHKDLAKRRWFQLSLAEQFANIGSEVGRAKRGQGKDKKLFWGAVERALELFDLTLQDLRWRKRLREIARLREVFCDAVMGGREYGSKLRDLEKYFLYFAILAQRGR